MHIPALILAALIAINGVTVALAKQNTDSQNIKQALQKEGTKTLRGTQHLLTKKLNLNEVNVEALTQAGLRGIGKKRAEAIINYRNSLPSHRFESIDQLKNVKGISERLVEILRTKLTIK